MALGCANVRERSRMFPEPNSSYMPLEDAEARGAYSTLAKTTQ
jgi:hypothetical protein